MPSSYPVDKKARKAMKYNILEGVFAVLSDNFAGPYLAIFALSLGASPSQMGMLSAFPALLGNILQIPYGMLTDKISNRKLICVLGGSWLRGAWLLMAFVPFLFPPEQQVAAVIVLATLRITLGNLHVPAWTSLQAEIIPRQIRGKYYANRNVILNTGGLIATFFAGRLLTISYPINYQVLFIVAAIFGVVGALIFIKMPIDPRPKKPKKSESDAHSSTGVGLRDFWMALKESKNFRSYCLSSIVWNIGVNTAGPLISMYYINDLKGTPDYWAVITAASIFAGIICQRYWGRLADRYGQKNVMSVSGIGAVLVPFLWFIIPNGALGAFANFWSGFMWGGYNLAAFNLLLEITPEGERPMYVGVYNTLVGIATAIGPLLGGFLAELITLRVVLLVSFALRGLGLFVFNQTVENDSGKRIGLKELIPFQKSISIRLRG